MKDKFILASLIWLPILAFLPYMLTGVLECYRYSPLILSKTVLTKGSLDFEDLAIKGDLFRERAFVALGAERPLSAILYVMLSLATSLSLDKIPWIPITFIGSVIFLLSIAKNLMYKTYYKRWYYIPTLFLSLAFLQLIGIVTTDLSYAYLLLIALIYLSEKLTIASDLRTFVLALTIFIALSMIHYSVFVFSSIFLITLSLLTAVKYKAHFSRSLLFAVLSASIVTIYHTFYLNTLQTVSHQEFINMMLQAFHTLFNLSPPLSKHSPYVEPVLTGILPTVINWVFKLSIYLLGFYALIMCIIKRHSAWPIITALTFMSVAETAIYIALGEDVLLSTLTYITFPLIIIIWFANKRKAYDNCNGKKRALLIAMCLIIVLGFLRAFFINSQWYDVNSDVAFTIYPATWIREKSICNTSYEVVASAESSALISYYTLEPGKIVIVSPLRLSLIIDEGVGAFTKQLSFDPYDIKLIILSASPSFIRSGAWVSYWLLKEQVLVELGENLDVVYSDGVHTMYAQQTRVE